MTKNPNRPIPIVILFFGLNALLLAAKTRFVNWGVDYYPLLGLNSIVFLAALITFFWQKKSLAHKNPQVFIRTVMGTTFLKMFLFAIAIGIYIVVKRPNVDKWTILAGGLLYILYLVAEVAAILKLNNARSHPSA